MQDIILEYCVQVWNINMYELSGFFSAQNTLQWWIIISSTKYLQKMWVIFSKPKDVFINDNFPTISYNN